MRIVFICGALESGRDGVGDYTRLLASELIRTGTPCGIVALNDHFISATSDQLQQCEGVKVKALRIRAGEPFSERAALAKKWVERFSPDIVSLQFVPYAFHPKGLSTRIAGQVSEMAGTRKTHIMFHETWIGFSKIHPFKDRIYGFFQRYLAVGLVRKLKPIRVHTSNRLYELHLADHDIKSDVLPIFSNIPVSEGEPAWMRDRLSEIGIQSDERDAWMILGIFGSIHSDFSAEEPLQRALDDAGSKGLKVALVVVGRAGSGLQSLESLIENRFSQEIAFGYFGEQSSDHVSQFCKSLDYAVATMPREFMDKSGTIAAFHAHDVAILESRSVFFPEYDERLRRESGKSGKVIAEERTVSQVARNFLKSVGTA